MLGTMDAKNWGMSGLIGLCLSTAAVQGQSLQTKLQQAFQRFSSDAQMTYASVGFCVQNAAGETVFSSAENTGLAPASTLKIVTAATALETLGPLYTFKTRVFASGKIMDHQLQGHLLVEGSGDPTLGSWRYPSKPDTAFFWQVYEALTDMGVDRITGDIIGSNTRFSPTATPGGWIYDDIGNYYGAGSWALNFHENQYDAVFNASGRLGDTLALQKMKPDAGFQWFHSFIKLGAAGTGDNSIIYAAPYSQMAYGTGSLGKTNQPFTVSGAIPFGENTLLQSLKAYLIQKGIAIDGTTKPALYFTSKGLQVPAATLAMGTYQSVALDSVVYWFMQKSINLYGEAIAKTLALEAGLAGDTDAATDWIRNFWATKGIDRNALRMMDGSGLSPQNRITAKALVQVLQYAKKQAWFPAFYEGLPTIHGLKMKSGTISGAKGYTGFVSAKNGQQYCFALLVNNYNGSANAVVQKMWQLLDVIANN